MIIRFIIIIRKIRIFLSIRRQVKGQRAVNPPFVLNAAQLNYSGAITITGTGTKTASVSGVLIMTGKGSSAVGQFKITIGGQTFNCAQGYNGTDYYHATFAYFPVESGQSYTIEEISNFCDLRLIPYRQGTNNNCTLPLSSITLYVLPADIGRQHCDK